MSRSSAFFATRQDSLDLLLSLEKRSPLYYVRWGHYPSRADAPRYETASDIPDLGTTDFGRKGDNRYLVLPTQSTLTFYKSSNAINGTEYEPQPSGNSPYVFFHSGGIYRDECLITGELWTAFETREAVRFFDRFYRALRTGFIQVGSGYRSRVGPEAFGLLRAGMRFTDSFASPRTLDFKLPRDWRPPRGRELTGLCRCVVGNSFCPAQFSPTWRTDTVLALARQMYEGREFSAMPILGDALQDAGCDNADILDHCHSPGPHVRGCWVLDLVLGKE